jgi:hypothetical protein
MKLIVSTILIGILGFISGLYLPWWSISLVAFIVSLFIHLKPLKSFLSGFIAIFLTWGILAFWIDSKNDHILSHRMSLVLPFGGSSFIMVVATAFVGGLVAGLASLTASFLSKNP